MNRSTPGLPVHHQRLWWWEGLGAGGEGDDRGWDGWMASRTRWTWVWVNSRSWWWTGRPGVLRFMGSQRAGHNWETRLNWTHILEISSKLTPPSSITLLTSAPPSAVYKIVILPSIPKPFPCFSSSPHHWKQSNPFVYLLPVSTARS